MTRVSVRAASLVVAAMVTVTTAGTAVAAPPDLVYKDRRIAAYLEPPSEPPATLGTIEVTSVDALVIAGTDILTFRSPTAPPREASASVTGRWVGCDTATDELVDVYYFGAALLPDGIVTVDPSSRPGHSPHRCP
jgi:hypothetical protein